MKGNSNSDIPAQMSMKKRIKLFRAGRELAVKNEMKQLHDWKVMSPVNKQDLTYKQQKKALGYLMFLKWKCYCKIKGRGCADGWKQNVYITKRSQHLQLLLQKQCF